MYHWALTELSNLEDVIFVRRESKRVKKYCVHRAMTTTHIESTQTSPVISGGREENANREAIVRLLGLRERLREENSRYQELFKSSMERRSHDQVATPDGMGVKKRRTPLLETAL